MGEEQSVLARHKAEWQRHQTLMDEALADYDLEKARLAKVMAETLRIRQEGERKAWGLSSKGDVEQGFVLTWKVPTEEFLRHKDCVRPQGA
ncbi:MAG: hypothetical protein IJU37_09775 [Desulfovibrio sp.]|nr:hypothetical protein [Desulfovibrio sp.]